MKQELMRNKEVSDLLLEQDKIELPENLMLIQIHTIFGLLLKMVKIIVWIDNSPINYF